MTPSHHTRGRIELRLLGLLGLVWWMALFAAALWSKMTLGWSFNADLPWAMLALPHAVALTACVLALYGQLPSARWARTRSSPPATVTLLLGFPSLPFAPLFIARDRRATANPQRDPAVIQEAFVRLLRAPRLLASRFWIWGAAALSVDAIVLGRTLGWSAAEIVLSTIMWIALLTPLASMMGGYARAVMRPEYLSAPHRVRSFPQPSDLRARLISQASVVAGSLVAAPLCGASLFHLAHPSSAVSTWGALAFGGFIFIAAATSASMFVARAVHRDVVRATRRTRAVVSGHALKRAIEGTFTTREARELVGSVDRLVGRIVESNVARYVAIEKAKEADRLKSQFLANMSHDLRSPLNSILGFSELMLTGIDGDLTPPQREMVKTIWDNGRALLREIDDILDTAKIEAGKVRIEVQATPIVNLLTRAIAEAKRQIEEQPTFEIQVAPGLPPTICDPMHTASAIAKVLRFAHEGTENPEVSIMARQSTRERKHIIVDIASGHRPASSEDLDRARSGFFRLPGHRGLGLGLPIADSVLGMQGGGLSITEFGPGMVFTIEIPSATKRPRSSPHEVKGRSAASSSAR